MRMRVLVSLLLIMASVMAVSASYNIVVAENGNAFVATTLTGSGTVNLPLPIDATPQVSGGLYINAPNGIDITVGSAGAANIIYKSSTITIRDNGIWSLDMDLSSASPNSVTVSLPSNADISTTTPQAEIVPVSGSKNVVWSDGGSAIALTYSFTEPVAPTAPATPTTPTTAPQPDYLLPIAVVLVLIVAVAGYFFVIKKKA